MAGRLSDLAGLDVLVIRPGDPAAIPASLNPLEPATLDPLDPAVRFPLQSHADLVRALFLAAFRADEPFPQVLSQALHECYANAGWDLVTGRPLRTWAGTPGRTAAMHRQIALPRYPTLLDVQLTARRVVEQIGYGDDVKKNVRGFVDVRIGSLRLGTPGRFFEGGHPLDVAALLKRNVVIEAEGITSDQDKAFVMGALLVRLYEQLLLEERQRFERDGGTAELRHVTVVEEAHRLLRNVPPESPAAYSLELFASLLSEVRAYGEGVIVAEQIPSKLLSDVIKNTALKIVHRLPALDDRTTVGATINLSQQQSEYVVTLAPGAAALFSDGMDRPVLAQMPRGDDREDDSKASRLPPIQSGARRSRACGYECTNISPCTLQQLRKAEHLLAEHPELTLWTELTVVAHGCGWAGPTLKPGPRVEALRRLGSIDRRLVECAIAHAIEAAVAPRYVIMTQSFDPDALGHHLSLIATALLRGRPAPDCSDDKGRWRMGSYRFSDVVDHLAKIADGRENAQNESHWIALAAERGLQLVGSSPQERVEYLRSLPWVNVPQQDQRLLLAGSITKPLALVAAASISGRAEALQQLTRASAAVLEWTDPGYADQVISRVVPVQKELSDGH
jgi:hypothetical protein